MSTFKEGQTVVAVNSEQWRITQGKRYVVTHVQPEYYAENGFKFPEYVTVIDDFGGPAAFHTYRFRAVD